MSSGHSFPKCSNVIVVAYSWALDELVQAIDRIYRLNSVKDVNAYFVICDRSIDRKLEGMHHEKADASDLVQVTGGLKLVAACKVKPGELLAHVKMAFVPAN